MIIHWDEVLQFSMAPLEIIVRGTITYWFIFILFRLAGRRDIGSLGIADLLLVVLIADAAQNAMAGEYKAVPDGLVLITTLVSWSVFVDRIGYFFPAMRKLLEPSKLCLIRNGELQRRAMRREYITLGELESELRLQGILRVEDVHVAYMEPDGKISAIKKADSEPGKAGIWEDDA